MKKVVMFFLLTLFLLMPVLPIEGADEPNGEVELDLTTQISGEVAGPPEVIESDAKVRYGWDFLVYSGAVNANAWAVPAGVDDESIDVDFCAADTTLRAVVACADSNLRILKSDDRGVSWSLVRTIHFGNSITDPHIVYGPDSTYHAFCLYNGAEHDIYASARSTTTDDYYTSPVFLSGDDSVQNYSVCTDRSRYKYYYVFLTYQAGTGNTSKIMFTRTTDQGLNWSTPAQITVGHVGFPDITYGRYILYLSYLVPTSTNYYVRVRRSLNSGSTWTSPLATLESDTFPKMAPQIAAAHDNSGDVWLIWPKWDALGTAPEEWSLRWSWSQDSAITWSSPLWTNSRYDSSEYLPSIAVNDYFGSDDHDPHVCYLRADDDNSNPYVRIFHWSSGAWTTSNREGDYNASLTRPIQTFNFSVADAAAFAYVGEGEQNVYFDTWESSGVEEKDIEAKITCSLDRSIITGTATLKYNLPNGGPVNISMFNVLGQKVATLFNGVGETGENTLVLSSDGLSQGVYYIAINAPDGTATAKATIIK